MNTTTPYRYELDKTGVNPDNLVVDEYHSLANLTARCIAPTYGNFYTEGVIIRNFANGAILRHGIDYMFGEIQDILSERYAKEICAYIVISAPGVTAVKVTYQALGGEYSYSMGSLIEMLESMQLDSRPVEWGSITNKPVDFEPHSHWHKSSDLYGMEYVVHSIERLRNAVLMGDVASHDEIYRYIDRSNSELETMLAQLRSDFNAHASNISNPHNTTKAQVGLGSVENFTIASLQEAQTGTATNRYMTPQRVAQAIEAQVGRDMDLHMADLTNPHQVTKGQVGLGLVNNYATATTIQALDGDRNDLYMTPDGTRRAIVKFGGELLGEHEDRFDNPHQVTKTQVGLNMVENYPIATQQQAIDGLSNDSYMTPLRVRQSIAEAVSSGDYDDRYVARNIMRDGNVHTRADLGIIYMALNGVWRQVWPPMWQ